MDTITKSNKLNHVKEGIEQPCVTIVFPIDHKIASDNSSLKVRLLKMLVNAKELLEEKYEKAIVKPIIGKMTNLESKIDFPENKKSLIAFVSPNYDKMLFLDIPLEEHLLLDEHYDLRELLYSSRRITGKYLLLVQSAHQFNFYLGDSNHLLKLKNAEANNVAAYDNDIAERIENFTNIQDRKEVMLDKFIHHIEKELNHILNHYELPVFVIGTERMNGHFKKITHHSNNIVDYIHGNYEDSSTYELLNVVRPHFIALEQIENEKLLNDVRKALFAHKLCYGFDEVWGYAEQKMGHILLLEKNYPYPTTIPGMDDTGSTPQLIYPIDMLIEKVFATGGAVRFVGENALEEYGHIAMILHF